MRKLTKKELTQELRRRVQLSVYDVVVDHNWNTTKRTLHIAADNEIEAARIVREQRDGVANIFSITLREDMQVIA